MLADYAAAYKSAETFKDSKFIDPRPGVYECKCIKGEHTSSAKGDHDLEKFAWTLEITAGECAGMVFQRVEFLSDPAKASVKLGYIKGALERCGVMPPADVRDLPLAIQKCAGARIEVSVIDSGVKDKSGKSIKNVKFTKSLEFAQTQEESFSAPSSFDDYPEF